MTFPMPRSRATGRVTLADVARDADVSPITVSRALRGERAVDAALVARVQAAVSIRQGNAALHLGQVLGAVVVVTLHDL